VEVYETPEKRVNEKVVVFYQVVDIVLVHKHRWGKNLFKQGAIVPVPLFWGVTVDLSLFFRLFFVFAFVLAK
jgi:hypothetical protein